MDVFKLAFETTIVGLLALLCLAVAAYLLFPVVLKDFVVRVAPDFASKNQTLTGAALLTFTYCLGSAILPISSQLVNDEHWPLPENAIRCQVFTKQELQLNQVKDGALPGDNSLDGLEPSHCSYWAPVLQKGIPLTQRLSRFARLWRGTAITDDEGKSEMHGRTDPQTSAPATSQAQPDDPKKSRLAGVLGIAECLNPGSDACKKQKVLTLFQQQESAMLNEGTDRTERLRLLHERIVVLRGAVFSGFVLVLICLYAFFARIQGQRKHWLRTVSGALLSVLLILFAVQNGFQDLQNQNIFDLPVLEGLLVIITIFGAYLVLFKGIQTPLFHKKRLLLVVTFFAALAYGGWMSSEILYDQLVISSYAVLRGDPPPPSH